MFKHLNVVPDRGPVHPEVQGRRRHEQLRRLRGGAAAHLKLGKVRKGVRRLLKEEEGDTTRRFAEKKEKKNKMCGRRVRRWRGGKEEKGLLNPPPPPSDRPTIS